MTLANRIAVMDRGRIRQVGTPTEIYEYPKTRFVADFIGSINMFDGRVVAADGGARPRRAARARRRSTARAIPSLAPGQAVTLAVRPEKIAISRDRPDGAERRRGRRRGPRLLRQGLALPRPPRLGPHPLGALAPTPAASARTSASPSGRTAVWLAFDPSAAILLPEERDA